MELNMYQFIAKSFIASLMLIFGVHYCYAQLPEIESRSNLSCMIGGVGENESKAMREEAKKWPLNIEFSERVGKSDLWIAGAQLTIVNKAGNTIFEETCNGPLFLAKLVPGKYQLIATYQGVTQKRTIEIREGKSLKESFNWRGKAS